MEERITAPYGSWRSPLSAELVAAGGVGLGEVALADGAVYWAESRPLEGGRVVVVSRDADRPDRRRNAAGFNARTRVHEYGGGAYWTHHRTVYFSNFGDSGCTVRMAAATHARSRLSRQPSTPCATPTAR